MYRVAVQMRLEEYRRHRDASHIMVRGCQGTEMPLYIYILEINMAQGCLIPGLFN